MPAQAELVARFVARASACVLFCSAFAAGPVYTPALSPVEARRQDKAIRARLQQGDLDSLANLLLFGTSFTQQPRVRVENLTEAMHSGLLRARVDDLAAGLRHPGENERLRFAAALLQTQGLDPASPGPGAGVFLYRNLQRVLEERRELAERAAEAKPSSVLDRASLFSSRGVSLDTGILPNFSLEETLRDLKTRGLLRDGQVARAAVIGPGLDFIDKNEQSAFDYYPPQTLQPFALYDSLVRLALAKSGGLKISIFDISPRVLDHIGRARERARQGVGYTIQLPRDLSRPWPAAAIAYWSSLGSQVGSAADPIPPPAIFPGLPARAFRVRPDVVLACEPADLNIVVQRLDLPPADRFDLIVGTNIFIYYDRSQQELALENAGAMLKPGGLLLTNDSLPETRGGSMRLAGLTIIPFDGRNPNDREAMGWYQRR